MKKRNRKFNLVITGLMTLIILSLGLFWARKICQATLTTASIVETPEHVKITVKLNGFIPEFDKDPNSKGFEVRCEVNGGLLLNQFLNYFPETYFRKQTPGDTRVGDLCGYNMNASQVTYFDRKTGLLVWSMVEREVTDHSVRWNSIPLAFAGPQGISEKENSNLGRFGDSLLFPLWEIPNRVFCYDQKAKRFYYVNFDQKTVKQSQEGELPGKHIDPVYLGIAPQLKAGLRVGSRYSWGHSEKVSEELPRRYLEYPGRNEVLVLDRSGRIDRFDLETMTFVGLAGVVGEQELDELFGYDYMSFSLDGKYRGMAVASLDRRMRVLNSKVFDAKGKVVKAATKVLDPWKWEGGFTVSMVNWFLENLHPPILDVATYFTADKFSAMEGQKSIFLLSESLLGQLKRCRNDYLWEHLTLLFVVMLPTYALIAILVFKINREARAVGLSSESRRLWIWAAVLFGLTAYITWRLTRPTIVQVTCQNCGKLRRPDFDACQHCKSPWHVPDLTPPAWRVFDTPVNPDTPAPVLKTEIAS